MGTVLGVDMALGSISNLEGEGADALAAPYVEVQEAVRAAEIRYVDETGWKQAGKKRWLWVAATVSACLYMIHPRRNLDALRDLLDGLARTLVCDRAPFYRNWPDEMSRQYCWAHLKRNWEAMAKRGGSAKKVGEASLDVLSRVFAVWHAFLDRGGGPERLGLVERMEPLRDELIDILVAGELSSDQRTSRFCTRLLSQYESLWTFAAVPGVDPTNNRAERSLRRAVIWRRRSFGCHSAGGCRFVERVLTVTQTLRMQGKRSLDFMADAIARHRSGLPAPRLLSA